MSNLSVKLDEATRQRLQSVAEHQGITPHALMVKAIGNELERSEAHEAFVVRALAARQSVIENGLVIDGPAYSTYLRARVRGQDSQKPEAISLPELQKEHS